MARFLSGVLLGTLFGAAAVTSGLALSKAGLLELPNIDLGALDLPMVDLGSIDPEPVVRSTRRALHRALPEPEPREVNVVLSRSGTRLYPGLDHARLGLSSVLMRNAIPSLDVPAPGIGDRRWRTIRRCVEDRFSGFAVNVLEEPPATGDYLMVHFGGTPGMFGLGSNIRGLAPHTGRVIANAPVFVFTQGKPSTTELCEVAAHEVGHALGLDHSRLCSDIMSYGDCGPKRFREKAARCGEYRARDCESGEPEQSSARRLEAMVGRRQSAPAVS